MKTILITAYAVNPYKGSEDGTGWNISKQISKDYNTIIITRKNNREEIERYMAENKDPIHERMKFLYHDLPKWAMFWKKKIGPRGYVLYFYFWQLFMPLFIFKNKLNFDLCHVLNFHSDSHPHFLWVFRKPIVWGPIGHHPKMPKEYIKVYGKKVLNTDRKYAFVKWIMRNLDPFFYLSKWTTDKIIGINTSVQKSIRVKESKIEIIPAVATVPPEIKRNNSQGFNILSVGRFTPMKGFDITILAFSSFVKSLPLNLKDKVTLTLVGSGECEEYILRLLDKHDLNSSVNIISWVEKKEMETIYNASDVFLFPSHEGAGMVVPEAMSYGLPVLCFNNYGPGELLEDAGIKIDYSSYSKSIDDFSDGLKTLYHDIFLRDKLSKRGIDLYKSKFTWEAKGNKIKKIMKSLLEKPKTTIAVFHPSAELYGADRILVNALKAIPEEVVKKVYLFRKGPLGHFIENEVENVEVIIKPEMPVIYREIFTPLGIFKYIKDWFSFLFYLRSENKKNCYSSAYVNTLSCSFLLPLLWLLSIKRFVHVHEIIDSPKIVGRLTAWVSHIFSTKIVCVSNAVLLGLKRYVYAIEKKGIVIHNGINAISVNSKKRSETLNFYLFGRIKPEKGQKFLIESLKIIPKSKLIGTKFILMGGVVAGQEKELKDLHSIINKYHLSEHVIIKQFASNIESAMSDADVCLVPSLMKDPFPTTVLEAMSAAKPVITTNNGGAKEAVINNETGFLISPNDTNELANSIINLIDKRSDIPNYGGKAKARFQKLFTRKQFNKNWLNFNIDYNLI
jgi:glycosyltransferase involved in cell wall biosynthesis